MLDDHVRAERMRNLLLANPGPLAPAEIVEWLGALQAQDLASAMWSLGVRSPGSTEAGITSAFEEGRILRTWPMRGTIHVIPSDDAAWMLEVTGSRALDSAARRREQLGLSLADIERAASVLEDGLVGGRLLTRSAALAAVNEAGIDTSGQRGYYLLWHAAHLGVICIGPQRGSEQTFALLREWAPTPRTLTRTEGLVELAFRYFRSHGPTTVRDFAGWTGLTLTESRAAVAGNDGRLVAVGTGPEALWTGMPAGEPARGAVRRVLALPGFDELILGYKDRRLHVPDGMFDRVVPGGNGMFRSTIVVDGVVAATWRRTLRAGRVEIVVEPFSKMPERTVRAATSALEEYADYLGRDASVTFATPR